MTAARADKRASCIWLHREAPSCTARRQPESNYSRFLGINNLVTLERGLRAEVDKQMGKTDLVTVKALQLSVSNGIEAQRNSWDGSHLITTRKTSGCAYADAGISNPRKQLGLIEVHHCFSITELVTMEDLHIFAEGGAVKDVMDGFYDADRPLPCQIDGGLTCFGHPIGASGLRML